MINKTAELLKDPKVRQEIDRHKWFESEKAGHDIGFEKAAASWIKLYSKEWLKKNEPAKKPARSAKRLF